MKDRNGVEIQVGDVCVDHFPAETDLGEICEVVEIVDNKCAWFDWGHERTCGLSESHLEIIGNVR